MLSLLLVGACTALALLLSVYACRAFAKRGKRAASLSYLKPSQIELDNETVSPPAPEGPLDAMYDLVIVGAGVAGSSLAAFVGRSGKRILLIERDLSEPQRIVGELLQPGGVAKLEEMKLQECLEGFDAQRVNGYAILLGEESMTVQYPTDPVTGQQLEGRSFHHGPFIMQLRRAARAVKNVDVREGTVHKLLQRDGRITGVVYKDSQGNYQRARGHLTVMSDGCASLLRQSLCTANVSVMSHFLGVVLKDCACPFLNKGNVVLANPTPILCYPISSTEVRILVDFPSEIPSASTGELQKHLRNHVCPQLPQSLQQPFLDAVEQKRYKSMPNRVMPAAPHLIPGAVLLGDSLNMRHPLTGGGMTVAFTDVCNIGNRLSGLKMSDQDAVTAAVAEFYESRQSPNRSINILSEALYEVFCERNQELRYACFQYLSQGGKFAHGPISLLSGISRNQSLLISHFFAVALFAVYLSLKPYPTPARIRSAFNQLRTAVHIIHPRLRNENKGLATSLVCSLMRVVFWV